MATKFSEFPAGTELANADLVVGIQAGDNCQATKEMILTGAAGEDEVVKCSAGQKVCMNTDSGDATFEVRDNGETYLEVSGTSEWRFGASGPYFGFDANGGVAIVCGIAGQEIAIQVSGNCGIIFDVNTDTSHLFGTNIVIDFNSSGTTIMWQTAPPADYQQALNRLTAAVFNLLGPGQIP